MDRRCCSFNVCIHFFGAQMCISYRQADNETATGLSLRIVFNMDVTMVQFHQRTGQMKSDARTYTGIIQIIMYLLKTFKDMFFLFGVNADAGVCNHDFCIFV